MRTEISIGLRVLECGDKAQTRHRAEHRLPHAPQTAAAPGFTVLELLIVIGVLSVLLAIILPTVKTVRASALRNRAQTEATVLAQAAIRYKTEYGFWPGQLEASASGALALRSPFKSVAGLIPVIISRPGNPTFKVTTTSGVDPVYLDNNEVYQAFSRLKKPDGGTIAFDPNPLNPKGLHFLDLTAEGDMSVNGVSFPDPWGHGYVLFMGLNPKSTFTHTVTFPNGGTQVVPVKNTIAFAFSLGPDGINSTNYIYSAGVK